MERPAEILVADRFPALRRELLRLLADLSEAIGRVPPRPRNGL